MSGWWVKSVELDEYYGPFTTEADAEHCEYALRTEVGDCFLVCPSRRGAPTEQETP